MAKAQPSSVAVGETTVEAVGEENNLGAAREAFTMVDPAEAIGADLQATEQEAAAPAAAVAAAAAPESKERSGHVKEKEKEGKGKKEGGGCAIA